MLLIRDIGYIWTEAKDAIEYGDSILTDALAPHEEEDSVETSSHMEADEIDSEVEAIAAAADETEEAAHSLASEPVEQSDIKESDGEAISQADLVSRNDVITSPVTDGLNVSNEDSENIIASDLEENGPNVLEAFKNDQPGERDAKSEVQIDSSSVTFPRPDRCYYCGERLESPCWFCMDCNDVLICTFCDPNGGFDKGQHAKDHTLLSVRAIPEEEEEKNEVLVTISQLESKVDDKFQAVETTLDDRISALEARIDVLNGQSTESMNAVKDRIDQKFTAMDDRLSGIDQKFTAMDDRFSKIEQLLGQLLASNRSGGQ